VKKVYYVIAIINAHDYFIFDTYNSYIVFASSETDAAKKMASVPNLQDIDEIKEINEGSAAALIAMNRTKVINEFITQVILY